MDFILTDKIEVERKLSLPGANTELHLVLALPKKDTVTEHSKLTAGIGTIKNILSDEGQAELEKVRRRITEIAFEHIVDIKNLKAENGEVVKYDREVFDFLNTHYAMFSAKIVKMVTEIAVDAEEKKS